MRKIMPLLGGALMLILTACSDTTTTTTETKKEPEKLEPVTGQSALFKMYQVARSWAPDADVLKMNSILLSQVPDVPKGKAAEWQATFVSVSRSQARSYTYSIVEDLANNLHKGVFAGLEEAWSGARGVNKPFKIGFIKTDTDTAYQTALSNGGADYDKKAPGKPVLLLLEKIEKYPDPVWRVLWGESVGTSNFSVYVDASTGQFMEKLR